MKVKQKIYLLLQFGFVNSKGLKLVLRRGDFSLKCVLIKFAKSESDLYIQYIFHSILRFIQLLYK